MPPPPPLGAAAAPSSWSVPAVEIATASGVGWTNGGASGGASGSDASGFIWLPLSPHAANRANERVSSFFIVYLSKTSPCNQRRTCEERLGVHRKGGAK